MLPSLTDVVFLVLLGILAFSSVRAILLADGDTGWHIRNGEHILATRSVPATDYFSATKSGQPWYAWEWLWDASMAAVHARAGLEGVVVVTALAIALTFALLFHLLLRRSGDFVSAAVLVTLSAGASLLHMLARPHVASWLLTALWLAAVFRFRQNRRPRSLWVLPALTVVWANLHGGFIMGFAILAAVMAGEAWTWAGGTEWVARQQAKRGLGQLIVTLLACGLASFATPYGYRLHSHVAGYLSNSFLMDNINEFLSPNFHTLPGKAFEILLLLVLVAAVAARKNVRAADVFLVLLAVHSGLYAGRNLPLAAMILSLVAAPWLASAIAGLAEKKNGMGRLGTALQAFSQRMEVVGSSCRGHALALVVAGAAVAIAWHGGTVGGRSLLTPGFNPAKFPVRAADAILAREIKGPIFTADSWSGYLIYRLYPRVKLFVDDRHDFYGEAYMKEYARAVNARYGWEGILARWGVNWVLIDPDSPLANALKLDPSWNVSHDDGVAILFQRRK